MGTRIQQNIVSLVPEQIRDSVFFQDCVRNLSMPAGGMDHYGLEVCRQKTGELIGDKNWIIAHPRYAELKDYLKKHKALKMESTEGAVSFFKGALLLLDGNASIQEATQSAYALQFGLKHSLDFSKAELVSQTLLEIDGHPVVESTPKRKTNVVRIPETVIRASTDALSLRGTLLRRELSHLSRQEVKALQKNCVSIFAKKLQEEGFSREDAADQALQMLGKAGIDGKFGPKSQEMLEFVLDYLVEKDEIDLKKLTTAQALSQKLDQLSLAYTVREFAVI